MSKKITFSIVTVCYNAENEIGDTIKSVINQDYDQFEYIIIDGKSTDDTLNILKNNEDKIDCFLSEPDLGIYDAMNKGLKLAKGRFINFLNAGDRFVSNTILSEVASISNFDNFKIISGDFILVDDQFGSQRIIKTKRISFKNLKKDFYACHQSIYIEKDIASNYDLSFQIKADYKWVLEALNKVKNGQVHKLNTPLVYYSKEGFSNSLFCKNLSELIRLQYETFGFWQVSKNSHIYIYRLLRSIKDIIVKSIFNK